MVTLTLHYTLPKGAELSQNPQIKGLEEMMILKREVSSSPSNATPDETGPRGEIRFSILVDRVDGFETGPLGISYKDRAGKTRLLKAGPVKLTVLSNLGKRPEEARLAPIYGIIPTTVSWVGYLPWILGSLLFLAIAVWVIRWIRKRRRQALSAVDNIPPHQKARQAIQELEAEGLFEKGDIKGFYFNLSEILRRYLEALRGFPAAEYTTEEIAAAIRHPEDRDLIRLLKGADAVKFADMRPTPARKEDTVKQARRYIDKTGSVFESPTNEQAQHMRSRQIGSFPGRGTGGAGS